VTLNVDLWIWDLDAVFDTSGLPRSLMSPDEITRADRFVHRLSTQRYCSGRAKMREILATYCKSRPQDLTFGYGPNGKPFLPGNISFNLSHSENWAALGIVQGADIGVDVQKFRNVEPGVAHRFFSGNENLSLAALPKDDWYKGFYRCWTRKEAIVKGLGVGLSLPLDSFDVTLSPNEAVMLTRFDKDPNVARDWTLHHFDVAEDVVGAVAVHSKTSPVTITRHAI